MIRVFATTTLLAFALAGCSAGHTEAKSEPVAQSTDQPTGEASAPGDSKYPDPCKLFTKEDAAKTLGEPTGEGVFDSFGSDQNGGHCEYDATAGNGNNVMITVGSQAMIGPGAGDPVPDVGDEAKTINGVLWFRKGDVYFMISEVKNRHDGSPLPGTLFVPLAKIALSNL